MQYSSQGNDLVKAREILSFPHAELQKRKNGKNKIIVVGIFSVLYFPDYSRYILYLGDWSYALLRRVPVVAATQTSSDSRCYIFPAYTGDYVVKITQILHPEGIINLESILKMNSQFSYEWEEPKQTQREISPSDNLTEFVEHGGSYREKGVTMAGKLRGKEKVKKGFKKIKSKFTSHYSYDRQWNINLMEVRDCFELQRSDVDMSRLHHHLGRRDVEAIIVRSKDIAQARGYLIDTQQPTKEKGKENAKPRSKENQVIEICVEIEKGAIQKLDRTQQQQHTLQQMYQLEQDLLPEVKRLRLTEKEHLELAAIQWELTQTSQLQEQERRDLEIRKSQLFREAENREAQNLERARLSELYRIEHKMTDRDLGVEVQKGSEFQAYSRNLNIREAPTSIGISQYKLGEFDEASRP